MKSDFFFNSFIIEHAYVINIIKILLRCTYGYELHFW